MVKKVLISGASGLIGKKLIEILLNEGYQINILSRKPLNMPNVNVYQWDIARQEINPAAFDGVDTVVHLAGENIADKPWTAQRKKELIDSRVDSTNLLYNTIKALKAPVKTFVCASAIGFYGNRGDEILTEESATGNDFMADCCMKWETAAKQGVDMDIRVAIIRIGIVLSKQSGALKSMEKPVKMYLATPLGTGKQWMPWVHINDLTAIFKTVIANHSFKGIFNAVAPQPVTNQTFTKALGKYLHRPVWPLKIPSFILKIILGEMASLVLTSSKVSAQKIINHGYSFQFSTLEKALEEIYNA